MHELKNFLDKYGRDTTTNFYLGYILKEQNLLNAGHKTKSCNQRCQSPIKCSIIMRDEIKAYLDKDNLIINLQTSNEKGSHWILCSKKYNIYLVHMVLYQ